MENEVREISSITAVKCINCGELYFPEVTACMVCQNTDTQAVELAGDGKIVSYTWVHRTPPGVPGPYCLCVIDLAEGLQVWAQLQDAKEGAVEVGQKVRVCSIDENSVMKFA